MSGEDTSRWHPVLRSDELRAGDNIVAGFAAGVQLALWRSADGSVQAWEDRCPHRSVRLTLGQVVGDRLSCAYHGWQYAAGTGQCTGIPAHPGMPAPANVRVQVFKAAEAGRMVWVNLDSAAESLPATVDGAPDDWSFCRTLTVRANSAVVAAALPVHGFAATSPTAWRGKLADDDVLVYVLDGQPGLAFLHIWTSASPASPNMTSLHMAARALRSSIEGS